MNSYSQMINKEKQEHKKKMKLMKLEAIEEMNRETKQKEKMFFLLLNEEKQEQIRKQKELTEQINNISSFLHIQASKLSYRLWLTLRDYLTLDYVQIENDLIKGKITHNEYEYIKQIAKQL